jgi:Flp pilus assembly protein TadG
MTAHGRRTAAPLISTDEGAVAMFVVVITMALLAMAGLVIDGGYTLAARQEAANTAEQAARIGADALSRDSLRSGGPVRIDSAAAASAARDFLAAVGHNGEVTVSGDLVTVTVRVSQRMAILSAVGVNAIAVTGRASARGLIGIDRVEEGARP